MKPISRTKLTVTLVGLGMLLVLAIAFILKDWSEPSLWMAWFMAFGGTIGIYASANVAQKGVLKNETRPGQSKKT